MASFIEEVATAHSRDHKLLVTWRSDRHRHFPVKDQIHRACGIAVAEKDFPCLVVATSTQTRELYAALLVERRKDRHVGEDVSIIHERTSFDFLPLTAQPLRPSI
jgi:phosphopantetheine adenylyltransferase